ncbi:ABC transporter ATP-binding protein [Kineosporia sp. R_H_3]|uniref:ABC transporter ATP-binding protein n=1 Tax=Kineosporia sp. R_H_3 TaxID=1961848 RepID=UPI000B4B0287|nr:ABC transporter ATP-binding protein [Kineosporia sp. R_H_3]
MRFDAVVARYDRGGPPVLDGFDLAVEPGTLTSLLGPSGCGKTTALRLLAGLLAPTGGDVRVAGRSVLTVPTHRREVAVVFQQPLLFPHLDVAGNVAFGLRMQGVDRTTTRRRVADMLDLVHLSGLGSRRPAQLSGGQEQRVALARALVVRPRVLLLDEPLSQLDAGLREEMRGLVRAVQRELRLTTLFVTHDQEEAASLSDRVAVLLGGRVAQDGTPQELYERPASLPVARFLGTANLVPGVVRDGVWTGPLGRVPTGAPDGPATLAVRQESLVVDLDPDAAGLAATVTDARYRGTSWELDLHVGDAVLHAVTPPTLKAAPGDLVRVALPPGHGHVLPD